MNNEIIQYITQQLKSGFTLKRIRQTLLEHYPTNDINESIDYVVSQEVNKILPTAREMLKEGKSFQEVKQFALNQEHDDIIVNQLVRSLNSEKIVPQQNSPSQVTSQAMQTPTAGGVNLLAVFFAIIIFVGLIGGLYFFFADDQDTQLLDVSSEKLASSSTVYPGDKYEFKVEAINLGKKDAYDVTFTYYLEDLENNLITVESNTKAISTSLNFIQDISIPRSTKPGKYKITVEANYGDGIAKSAFTMDILDREIEINKETQEQLEQENQDSDTEQENLDGDELDVPVEQVPNNQPVQKESFQESGASSSSGNQNSDYSTYYSQQSSSIVDYYTDVSLPIFSVTAAPLDESTTFNKIDSLAKTDVEAAKDLCERMPLDGSQQKCFERVVKLSESSDVCDSPVSYMGYSFCNDNPSGQETPEDYLDCSYLTKQDEKEACQEFLENNQNLDPIDLSEIPESNIFGEGYEPPGEDDDYFGTQDNP
jgi:hypothetical protein